MPCNEGTASARPIKPIKSMWGFPLLQSPAIRPPRCVSQHPPLLQSALLDAFRNIPFHSNPPSSMRFATSSRREGTIIAQDEILGKQPNKPPEPQRGGTNPASQWIPPSLLCHSLRRNVSRKFAVQLNHLAHNRFHEHDHARSARFNSYPSQENVGDVPTPVRPPPPFESLVTFAVN